MARQKGMLNLSGNLEPLAGAPLDSRDITPTVADLYVASNWPYKYIGMKTTVTATGDTYRLVNLDVTQESSWVKEGSGESGASNLSDLEDVDLINPEEGEALIYDGEGGWTNGPAGQTYSDFTGATAQAAGSHGLVPAPTTGDISKFLKGDGTWATVPMPSFDYSNTSPEAMNFSTDEKVIGTWIDGKPLYQKTLDLGSDTTISATGWTSTSIDNPNVDKMIEAKGVNTLNTCCALLATVDAVSNKIKLEASRNEATIVIRYVTLRYTKTTDTAVASGEKIVGQWIDGKPVFEKTITSTIPTCSQQYVPESSYESIGVSVDKCIEINGFFMSNGVCTPISYAMAQQDTKVSCITVRALTNAASEHKNTIQLSNANIGWSGGSAIITLRYTKTT